MGRDENIDVKVACFCKDCIHSEKRSGELFCFYWDYEPGSRPNEVDDYDFCSNAEPPKGETR